MADGGTKAVVKAFGQKLLTANGIVALLGVAVLIIGLFIGSVVGRIICAIILLGAATFIFLSWRKSSQTYQDVTEENEEDLYSQHPEDHMKKLLFDDYQSSDGGKFMVKEIQEEEAVVPSTKSAQPVPISQKEEPVRELEMADFFDLDSDIFRCEAEPRSEFNFLLNKTLIALKEVLFAHSVAFFWANRDKGKMVLEANATDSQDFMTAKRFPIGDDVVSQVAKTGKPQLLGRLNPVSERELVHYYTTTEYINSILAVPVYFLNGSKDPLPVGVISADSKAEDAFGPETLRLLGQFTKLVSALIKSYTEKYDLLLDSELLSSIRRLQDRIKSDPSEFTILNSLAEEANRLLNWDYLTIALYGDEKRGWVLQKVVNKTGQAYVTPDQVLDFSNSVVGRVIKTNTVEVIDNLSAQGSIRFHSTEQIDSSGSFLCVPISSYNRCYGALTLESKVKANFSGSEVETIYRLVENAALALEVLYVNDLVKDFVVVDHVTGSFNKQHFLKKLEEEVQRADDFGTELALVSIVIDEMKELVNRHGKEGFDSILYQVVRIVRSNLRPYDVVGKQDADRIGVLLIDTAASEAYLWVERIRNQIASHIITLDGKSFSVTVSAGVCGLSESMRKDELIAGTSQVLQKAIEGGGNLVRVF
ncbi:MAG: diguanylate cyclase [Ignavibacteria bacterium]|nr:diguanylate cyclase [Ignavibacteria bacterium]